MTLLNQQQFTWMIWERHPDLVLIEVIELVERLYPHYLKQCVEMAA